MTSYSLDPPNTMLAFGQLWVTSRMGGGEIEDICDLSRFLGRHHDIVLLEDGTEGVAFNMRDHVKAACERYTSIPGVKPLKFAATSFCPDGSLTAADDAVQGELAKEACSVC